MVRHPELVEFAQPMLINMEHRTDRLRDSLAELARISGGTGPPDRMADIVRLVRPPQFDDPAGFANTGFRSNLHAHLDAARLARRDGVERALVLEDDIAFAAGFSAAAPTLLAELESRPWHVANLGYLDVWGDAAKAAMASGATAAAARWTSFDGRVNGTHAYLLHRSVLDRWIAHLEAVATGRPGDDLRGPMASDGALNTFIWCEPDVRRLLAVPNLVGARPSRSDISPGLVDRLPVVADVVERFRSWRFRRRRDDVVSF